MNDFDKFSKLIRLLEGSYYIGDINMTIPKDIYSEFKKRWEDCYLKKDKLTDEEVIEFMDWVYLHGVEGRFPQNL